MTSTNVEYDVVSRAKQSLGISSEPIYRMVYDILSQRRLGGTILDVGCGVGRFRQGLSGNFNKYIGADVMKYDGFPHSDEFPQINLDSGRVDLPDESADVVVGIETIEHLENPRAYMRELTRLCRVGGWIVVTTPNQLSLLSKLTLLFKNEFNAFRDNCYPAHITALLEVDLRRMATECRWDHVEVRYTKTGRIPSTAKSWPSGISHRFPMLFSDNVSITGRRTSEISEG
jgi:2-polyprenyl-3-methyl-5-hydroxy-6-metoxy-1,4-benzoquinol methylase